jgi:hypothetical protein
MKQVDNIWDVWDNGLYVGDRRSHGRVTVEPDWMLNVTGSSYADSKRGPFRYYQRADNSQVELEVPNVKDINIDRSIDTDISSCTINVYNQWMDTNGATPDLQGQLGKPGYLSWGHGSSPESAARWNQSTNSWENVLLPNALLRTYQGYGGFNPDGSPMDIPDAVDGGYLTLTGVWLVDDVTLNSAGTLQLKCRDVGKLLGVQQYFPPLVPSNVYLEQFCRWQYKQFDAKFNPRFAHQVKTLDEQSPQLLDSSDGRRLGPDPVILGHGWRQSIDRTDGTFSLSAGYDDPDAAYAVDWWEYKGWGKTNGIYVEPWGGNYEMYISIMEGGVWQTNGEGVIPYDATGADVDVEAGIPYVIRTGVEWETEKWYNLPRAYAAQKIRITFRNLTLSPWGPDPYRSGIREFKVRWEITSDSPPGDPWCFSIETYRNPSELNEAGYWVAVDDGQVFAFGDAREWPKNSSYPHDPSSEAVVTIRGAIDGAGYYLLETDGRVHTFGSATHVGDGKSTGFYDFVDMAVTYTGNGYYLLRRDGTVYEFGDAVHYGNSVPTAGLSGYNREIYAGTSIETHPSTMGYWVVDGNGEVQAFNLTNYGGINPFRNGLISLEWVRSIRRNSAGDGYWIVSGGGKVYACGAAQNFGNPPLPEQVDANEHLYVTYRRLVWSIAPTADDQGYFILQANGHISGAGNYLYFGEPGQSGMVRMDGNYRDYSDIVRLLLAWSGFLWFDEAMQSSSVEPTSPTHGLDYDTQKTINVPPIYGNIESTGAYADECLGLDVFDKKPIIDAINTLKEIVGYIFYIDDEGAAHFESPNWWSIGNFWEDGTSTDFIPEVDEATVLTDYSVSFSDASARSEIIISTEAPEQGNATTITTRLAPQSSTILRGMVVPAMWINGVFKNQKEQQIMAELIAMHIWFQQRIGSVSMLANPCIQVNDQVRIYERTTAESYVHYVRGISSTHNLDTGEYKMTLTTHWLGSESDWVITKDRIPAAQDSDRLTISPQLAEWLKGMNSRSIQIARLNDYGDIPDDAIMSYGGG